MNERQRYQDRKERFHPVHTKLGRVFFAIFYTSEKMNGGDLFFATFIITVYKNSFVLHVYMI